MTSRATGDSSEPTIVGSSPALLAGIHLARQAAPRKIPVLIIGETGTGKELLARLIHHAGSGEGPLVAVNCGALPDELAESILFGHKRGAFTGAVKSSSGLIAEAAGGTLLLDELSSLSVRSQSKLLRVLETGTMRRVGESRTRAIGFRLVATAQEDLSEMVAEGRFRADLIQRVAGCGFRPMPSTDSDASRPPIPEQAVQAFREAVRPFRPMPSTLGMGEDLTQ